MNINIARLAVVILGLTLWEITAKFIDPILLVPFSTVFLSIQKILLVEAIPGFYSHFTISIFAMAIAFSVVVAFGLLIGFALGSSKVLGSIFEPLFISLYAIPGVVLYPLFYLYFGIGIGSKIAFGVLLGLLPVISNTITGVRQLERKWIMVAKSMGSNTWTIFRKVIVPGSAPMILSGLRMGFCMSLVGVIAGEMMASSAGLGYLINITSGMLQTDKLYSLIVIANVLSVIGIVFFMGIERRWRKW